MHCRNIMVSLMEQYWLTNEYFVFPWLTADIIAKAEGRLRLQP